jgi:hypothetical protein
MHPRQLADHRIAIIQGIVKVNEFSSY